MPSVSSVFNSCVAACCYLFIMSVDRWQPYNLHYVMFPAVCALLSVFWSTLNTRVFTALH